MAETVTRHFPTSMIQVEHAGSVSRCERGVQSFALHPQFAPGQARQGSGNSILHGLANQTPAPDFTTLEREQHA